ncbi:penicillin-insensitive murein endopeptidase [Undibacterium flavidum]|uniref:Penicillin-insensitive murein endopeptidase n=1 Tax=Undibacterium flavidum TaxID=2762297 RepID=A0ABR6Y9U9_9BURK|nr:penicillin-insensitive murein endopeptidase [Undibacterium flavidum]MBC3873361.1 penicillin-insensitive murein endopeptidase [Undibacterium flavidum]
MTTAWFFDTSSVQAESICYGTSAKGRLEGGKKIPESGTNFTPYSSIGVLAGRTYVHAKVATIIEIAYQSLRTSAPDKKYVYGESGWEHGGRLRPHRTHQNGLAVDFMVAVKSASGLSIPLPTSIANKFGYDIEFDSYAHYKDLSIDFEAIAEHLFALSTAASDQGVKISRVIFEKSYLPRLYKTKRGDWIKQNISFMQGEPWIRHDEHYHVDFDIPCRPLSGK